MELWKNFDRLVVFDTETTGIEFGRDRIIEIGAVALENGAERGNFNALVRLPAGQMLPTFITELTGITDEQLDREGVDGRAAAEGFCRLLEGAERPLLVAYNAQFDLNFLYYLLKPLGLVSVLRKPRFLDALTVYRDRRDYPHKLCNAIEAYGLTEAENSHRAVDDARATVLLLEAMAAEKDDLMRYIDLFGTLTADDYYRTDSHWRQENLLTTADTLAAAMGVALPGNRYTKWTLDRPYYGVYYGYAALPMEPDQLTYLTSDLLDACTVYNYETGKTGPIYDLAKGAGKDPYELFLSGSVSLLTIENPNADTDRELVIFRDSFGSSLAPLLVPGYAKVTLADIRYLPSSQMGKYLTFTDQDVLFLYSAPVLNNSETLK